MIKRKGKMEAIILAGGFGTRISTVVKDVPKPMAPVNGKPFLQYVLNYLIDFGFERIILSVGYKKEVIKDYFGNHYKDMAIQYCEENKPLGTGGGIKKALSFAQEEQVFVLNGDTMSKIDYQQFLEDHLEHKSSLSLALKPMKDTGRYGIVKTNNANRIVEFCEKQSSQQGNINAGIYIVNTRIFDNLTFPEKFSFEKDFMEKMVDKINISAFCYDGYFIDIGIPEDFYRAQAEF